MTIVFWPWDDENWVQCANKVLVKGTLSLVCSTAHFEAFLTVSSLFISRTIKRVFQTVRALAGITAYYAGSVNGIEIYLILVHFVQIVLPSLLYEYKDQGLVGKMCMIFSFTGWVFNNSRPFKAVISVVRDRKFYQNYLKRRALF